MRNGIFFLREGGGSFSKIIRILLYGHFELTNDLKPCLNRVSKICAFPAINIIRSSQTNRRNCAVNKKAEGGMLP